MFGRRSFSAILTTAALLLATAGHAADTFSATGPAKPAPTPARPAPTRPVVGSALPAPVAAPAEATRPSEEPGLITLAGTILGPDGQPRPGVCVFLVSAPRLLAVTDARGTFQLQVPAATALRLQAEYVGLGSTRIDVDAQHPQAIRIVLGQ